MRVLVVVPARGGSKSIPNKNLAMCGGKPLIDWTLELLPHLDLPDFQAVVSTDCPKIAEHCKRQSVWVLDRPAYLAADDSTTVAVLQHALATVGNGCDVVLCLQPTNPLRTLQDISVAYRMMDKTDCDSTISYYETSQRGQDLLSYAASDGRIAEITFYAPRQNYGKTLKRTGEVYLTKRQTIEAGDMAGAHSRAYIIPRSRAWNIDDPWDIPIVEGLLRYSGRL